MPTFSTQFTTIGLFLFIARVCALPLVAASLRPKTIPLQTRSLRMRRGKRVMPRFNSKFNIFYVLVFIIFDVEVLILPWPLRSNPWHCRVCGDGNIPLHFVLDSSTSGRSVIWSY
jgi:NADH:ubiquinone oxidoreductase subunit 3 (subunit A)